MSAYAAENASVLSWILPIGLLLMSFLSSRAMEQAIVKFSGIIGFVGVSELVGFVFSCIVALCVESKHKGGKK